MKPKTKKIVFISIAAVLLALVIVLSAVVGMFSELIDKFVVGYETAKTEDNDQDGEDGARKTDTALSEQIQSEGIVLVKNEQEDGTALLPLKKAEIPKVNVFGWAASDWVISGSGSGQVKRQGSTDFYAALTEAGIEYNTALKAMYDGFRSGHREYSINGSHTGSGANPNDSGSLHRYNDEFSRLYEPSINDSSVYTETIKTNALNYSQTAFVVIGRVSGESNDSPKVQYKYNARSGSLITDKTRTYLEISVEEEDLLKYVAANYENVVVLINSTNVMELGFVDTIKSTAAGKKGGIDACLVVATTGTAGTKAIPKTIYSDLEGGSYNPSGKLADTYAYDLSTSSTYIDTGSGNDTVHFTGDTNDTNHFYTNSNSKYNGKDLYPMNVTYGNATNASAYKGVSYQEYREGVYMGYKWYETADDLGFWTSDAAKAHWKKPGSTTESINGYDDVVQYPFGYGLSYTEFTWNITHLSVPNNYGLTNANANDTITIGVTVKNTGNVAGKDVIELYYTLNPSKDAGIERASVNLLAFAKTQNILQPGDSEYVELKFKVSDLASYDYQEKIITGGGYVIEAGDILLSLRTDAHTLAGNKIVNVTSGEDKSEHTTDTVTLKAAGNIHVKPESENRFTGENTTDGVAIDGNSDLQKFNGGNENDKIVYLSRADFVGTFPFEKSADRAMTDEIKALNLFTKEASDKFDEEHDEGDVILGGGDKTLVYEDGAINELGFKLGMDYNAPEWEDVLSCIPQSQMESLVLHGYTKTMAIPAIGKPQTMDLDGPNQPSSFADSFTGTIGFSSIALAQTWNTELAYDMGLSMGAECAKNGIRGLYGPGVNVHRSPFGGRNYEYYSEDAYLSGIMCAKFVAAAKHRGVFCYLKHICLYEGETGRDSMYTWLTEQALREIYLKPFEIAVRYQDVIMGTDGKEINYGNASTAIMTSYGRIGAVWTGGSYALLTEVVRGEWGFKGAFLTDYADHHDFMNASHALRAGGDLWMDGWQNGGSFTGSSGPSGTGATLPNYSTTSNAFKQSLKNATKNIVYMWLNALATNQDYNQKIEDGLIVDTPVIPQTPKLKFRWYIPVVVAVDVLLVGGAGVLVLFAFWSPKKKIPAAESSADTISSGEPTAPNQE